MKKLFLVLLSALLLLSCGNSNPVSYNPIYDVPVPDDYHLPDGEDDSQDVGSNLEDDHKPIPVPLVPSAPSNLTAVVVGFSVQVRFIDNSEDNKLFRIERKIVGQNFEFLVVVDTTVFMDISVEYETEYKYRVRSFNRNGISYWITSNAVLTTTRPIELKGIYFDQNYIEIPDANILSPRSYTLELWVKELLLNTRSTYIFKSNGTNESQEYNLMENGAGVYAYMNGRPATDLGFLQSSGHPVLNIWTHVAVCFDTDINTLEIFVGGVSVGQRFLDREVENTPGNPGNLYFGRFPGHPGYNAFNGTLDEIRISNVARYSSDFTPVIRFAADSNTIALYHFDGSGDVILDSSGNGNHGQLVGGTRQ